MTTFHKEKSKFRGTEGFIETSGILEKAKRKGRKGDWNNIKGLKSRIPHHMDQLAANT
jgi:hypothetical protein